MICLWMDGTTLRVLRRQRSVLLLTRVSITLRVGLTLRLRRTTSSRVSPQPWAHPWAHPNPKCCESITIFYSTFNPNPITNAAHNTIDPDSALTPIPAHPSYCRRGVVQLRGETSTNRRCGLRSGLGLARRNKSEMASGTQAINRVFIVDFFAVCILQSKT